MSTRVVLFDGCSDGALEFIDGPRYRLVGIARVVFDDDGIESGQSRFHGAQKVVGAAFGLAHGVAQVRFDAGDVVTETMHGFLDDGFDVLGHTLAALGVVVGVKQNLHTMKSLAVDVTNPV